MYFKALVVTEAADGVFHRKVVDRSLNDLPDGEVCINVRYSSLNYKDALSATGHKGVTRTYPHTPGIDAVGIVTHSHSPLFQPGEEVIVTGFDLGMNTAGGWGQYIRVPADWVVHKPAGLSAIHSMAIGTAGLTAAIALYKMELLGMHPGKGEQVITGASGGVGSLATALLAKNGYSIVATTGKPAARDYLTDLGAKKVEQRQYVDDHSGKPLLKCKWAGGIDTVGGNTLATLLKCCGNEGVIASTGLVASADLATTVLPFILNGVSLVGVGSATTPLALKKSLWEKLSTSWAIPAQLDSIATVVSLEAVHAKYIDAILHGQVTGRIVVNMQ